MVELNLKSSFYFCANLKLQKQKAWAGSYHPPTPRKINNEQNKKKSIKYKKKFSSGKNVKIILCNLISSTFSFMLKNLYVCK